MKLCYKQVLNLFRYQLLHLLNWLVQVDVVIFSALKGISESTRRVDVLLGKLDDDFDIINIIDLRICYRKIYQFRSSYLSVCDLRIFSLILNIVFYILILETCHVPFLAVKVKTFDSEIEASKTFGSL